MSARPIRVLVVDDHRIFAAGVSGEITAHDPGLAVVGQADDVESAIAAAQRLRPDVVLLDVHLPGGQGGGGAEVADALHELTTAAGEPVRALALSVSDAEDDVLAVIRAGARGYVTKSILPADLVAAIRRVAEGDAVFSPREQEVMKLIARGYTYREAGSALFISDRTVESHVSSVLRKLQLTNRRELARWARDRRVI